MSTWPRRVKGRVTGCARCTARWSSPAQSCPAYLLDDDAKAEQAARAMIAGGDRSTAGAARQQVQARKNRRKGA
jgi:hypothetical protein